MQITASSCLNHTAMGECPRRSKTYRHAAYLFRDSLCRTLLCCVCLSPGYCPCSSRFVIVSLLHVLRS